MRTGHRGSDADGCLPMVLRLPALRRDPKTKTKPRKISIILQNNTTVDNGFVTLAPKRSEFYATPSQENDGVDWLKKLAVHEYRHVIQFEKFEDGVGKALKLVFGEQGMGALILLTTPLFPCLPAILSPG